MLAQHSWSKNQAQIYWIFGSGCGWSWLASCCWVVVGGCFWLVVVVDCAVYGVFFIVGFIIGENTILVLTFWDHSQFGPYILAAVNLVPIIFYLQSICSLPLTH